MPRKKESRIALTPQQAAIERAQYIVKLREDIDDLEVQLQQEETLLREYVAETGETAIGPLLACERLNPAKLTGLTGKSLEMAQEQLCEQLAPTYWKKKLDVSRMFAGLATDFTLRALLAEKGLQVEQTKSTYFKVKV